MDLAEELANLPTCDRDQLKQRWRRLYNNEPPAKMSRGLLHYAIAYALQEEMFGGLTRPVAKMIENSLTGKVAVPVTLHPGAKLLREWNGTVHEVEVLSQGVLYRGQRYRSLSQVAQLITGIHRSGPLFFGLKQKRTNEPRPKAVLAPQRQPDPSAVSLRHRGIGATRLVGPTS